MRSGVEREVKLEAPEGFAVPDLSGAADGLVARIGGERDLDATYYDTPDLRLARWGVSVRRLASSAGRHDGPADHLLAGR